MRLSFLLAIVGIFLPTSLLAGLLGKTAVTGVKTPHQQLEADHVPLTILNQRYEILQRLGAGSYGTVYKAATVVTRETVAIKVFNIVLPISQNLDKLDTASFYGEVKAFRAANGARYLLRYIKAITGSRYGYIVLEHCERGDLETLLANRAYPANRYIEKIATMLIKNLIDLHWKGITHRDLNPKNILVRQDWSIRVADLGLASVHQDMGSSVRIAPQYAAPEMLTGGLKPSGYAYPAVRPFNLIASDIWAYGIILYQMHVGYTPWHVPYPRDRHYFAYMSSKKLPLPAEIHPIMQDIIRGALAIDPRQRWKEQKILAELSQLRLAKDQDAMEAAHQSAKAAAAAGGGPLAPAAGLPSGQEPGTEAFPAPQARPPGVRVPGVTSQPR